MAFAVIGALIKIWPVIQDQTIKAKAALRGEKRDELHNCQTRLDELDSRLDDAVGKIHQLELKLVGTVSAYRILHDHLYSSDPDNIALLQARTIFSTTWDGPLAPSGAML